MCEGLPLGIKKFIQYSWDLKFYEVPDYNYLKYLLFNLENFNKCDSFIDIFKKSDDQSDFTVSSPAVCPLGVSIVASRETNKSKSSFIRFNNDEFEKASALSALFVDDEDKKIIEKKYIKNTESFRFNKILRTQGPFGLNEEDLKLFYALLDAINSQQINKNLLAFRYVNNNYLKNVFNFIPSEDINYNISMIKQQIGSIKIEKAFMSCFMTERHIIERNIKLKIKIPKGTNAYITNNKEESEIILSYNTKYKILNAYTTDNKIIEIEIIILNDKNDSIKNRHNESIGLPLNIKDFIQ